MIPDTPMLIPLAQENDPHTYYIALVSNTLQYAPDDIAVLVQEYGVNEYCNNDFQMCGSLTPEYSHEGTQMYFLKILDLEEIPLSGLDNKEDDLAVRFIDNWEQLTELVEGRAAATQTPVDTSGFYVRPEDPMSVLTPVTAIGIFNNATLLREQYGFTLPGIPAGWHYKFPVMVRAQGSNSTLEFAPKLKSIADTTWSLIDHDFEGQLDPIIASVEKMLELMGDSRELRMDAKVPDFTTRLADEMGLQYVGLLSAWDDKTRILDY